MKLVLSGGAALLALITAGVAQAADRPFYDVPIVPWSWAGLYVGGHIGATWGWKDWRSADGALAALVPFQAAGMTGGKSGGLQVGYNWQAGSLVFGVELSGSWADVYGDAKCAVAQYVCNTKVDWFGTATGRLGWATGRVLYYGEAGVAVAHDRHNMLSPFFINVFNGSATRWGWTAGAGVEYAFAPSWSAFVEYNYLGFGTKSVAMTDQTALTSNVAIRQNIQLVKFGMNYQLGRASSAFSDAAQATALYRPTRSEWTAEAGTRYWISSGKMKKDLYDPFAPGQLNSRLTYGPETGHSLEAFARFEHNGGLFVKGFMGFGVMADGSNLLDEDFPPAIAPYSATDSTMKNGRMAYGAVDVGQNVFNNSGFKGGVFVGYRFYYQQSHGYGCTQVATSAICAPAIPTGYLGLSETETWRGIAFGINAQALLTDRVKVEVDAAYLPYVDRSGMDNHWFRADINPQVETGHGWGLQLEALVSYALTHRWNVGAGARYWYFATTSAQTQFPTVPSPSSMNFETQRFGGFVQASYYFDDSDMADQGTGLRAAYGAPPMPATATNWTGLYFGGHFGGGWGAKEWLSATGTLGITGPLFPGSGDVNGLLAGGQVGFHYQMGTWVVGAEADASWSNLDGNAKCAVFAGPTSGTCNTRVGSLGTITAHLGRTYGKFMFYGEAGVAWANDKHSVRSFTVGPLAYTGSSTNWGWTLGSGIAYALSPHWSIDAEYNYLALGKNSVTMTDPVFGQSTVVIDQRLHIFKLGANYRFKVR